MRPPDAFVVDGDATPASLARAAALLAHGTGTVMVVPDLYLRPGPLEIRCELVDTSAAAHRCEEEYKVLVENGARALARSPLAALLPGKPLRWVVVEARGGAMVETWSERSTRSR